MENKQPIIIGAILIVIFLAVGIWYGVSKQNSAIPTDESQMQPSGMVPAEPTTDVKGAMEPTATTDIIMAKGAVNEITVDGSNFKFEPNTLTVKKGDTVKIIFKNAGGMHDFRIDELGIKTNVIKTGEQESVEFTADKVGQFEYYCSVGKHREMGMKGTLVVE